MTIAFLTHRFVRLAIAAVAVTAAATTAASAQPGVTYEVVSSFDVGFMNGLAPSALRQVKDGTFYGTTINGGMFRSGTLFRMDATGVITTLYSFGFQNGIWPTRLVQGSNGDFYGVTSTGVNSLGGVSGSGAVFRFTPSGALTTVHSVAELDGAPVDLLAASDGNVYGLTAAGGDFGNGTIFMIDPAGGFRTIYSLPLSAGTDMSSLVKGSDGRFYGTAGGGGAAGFGTVFMIEDAGTLTILHSFAGEGAGDGAGPEGLIQSRDGRLYGTTRVGGKFGLGTVYSVGLIEDYRVLHSFDGRMGAQPESDLVEASDGDFYGSTLFPATLFRIDSSGTLTTLHALSGFPSREMIQAADGRLYGTTIGGGLDGGGTIITIELQGALTTLHDFGAGASAGRPNGLIQARNGQFYGTTSISANPPSGPTGTVFAMDATGARTTLHTFRVSFASGIFEGTPLSNLFEGADGSMHGTTYNPADSFRPPGQIFRISPAGDFTTLASAYWLRAGVIQARDGRLYGIDFGGEGHLSLRTYGSVFRVEADGTRTVLHEFDGTDSANPVSELVEVDDGSLYGTTGSSGVVFLPVVGHGTIFRVDPATGMFTTRYRFSGPDGSNPLGRLIQGTDGLIYGTTVSGGAFGRGTVFSLDAAGTLTTLHHFTGTDGRLPGAGVIQGLDGRLYGTTWLGGALDEGTVFVMDVTGRLTTLHHFTFTDGTQPETELIQASDGAFYGTTLAGGPNQGGVIFRIRLATSSPDQYVEIVSRNSGMCLDVSGGSTDAAAPVIQWTCHGGPNQQWRLEPAGGGAFRIIARHSGQVLDVSGGLVDDVTPIIQWPEHGGDNQAWTLEPAADGYVRIVARHSGKAMDVEFASTDEGARVIQYTPHGNANQQWLLRPAP
jgi:uncharacterized repeat protein (TIGR03803 family)